MSTPQQITAGASLGIYALVFGTLLGFGLETLFIGVAVIKRNFSLCPRIHRSDPSMRIIIGQFLPVVAGTIIMGSTEIVDKGMAAALAPGSVASLNYGNKIIAAVLTLATTAIGTAVLPYFSRMVARPYIRPALYRFSSTWKKKILDSPAKVSRLYAQV